MNRYLNLVVLAIFLIFAKQSNCQETKLTIVTESIDDNTSFENLLKHNNDCLLNDLYKQSLASGQRLLKLEPNNPNYNFRVGVAIFNVCSLLEEPLPYLKKSIENVSAKADLFNKKEKAAPLDAHFYYALTLHRNEEIDEAITHYQKFIELVGPKHLMYTQANLNLKQAMNAKNIQKNEDVISISGMNPNFNSPQSEFSPIISFDGSNLYFTSDRRWEKDGSFNQIDQLTGRYYEDIFVSSFVDENWSDPKIMDFCSPSENEASVSVSFDERRIYLYNSQTGNGDIYFSNFENGQFNQMMLLENTKVNTDDWQSHFVVSPNGKYALFTSNNPKGFGGQDIYMMEKDHSTNKWSDPINLGPEINTEYDEDAPFLSFDGKTLYFSSNSDKSIGGFDIFQADFKDGKFTNARNMGTPINSTYDDLFYTVTADGTNAFISSFRKNGNGLLDIYEVINKEKPQTNSVLKGRIFLADNEDQFPENVSIDLKCMDCDPIQTISILPRLRDGKFLVPLEKCKTYEIHYINTETNEVITVQHFQTNCEEKFEEIVKELSIDVNDGKIKQLNIYQLLGKVIDTENNNAIADATIEIKNAKGEVLHTLNTDKNGKFITDQISDLKIDTEHTYTVTVSKEDYITVSKDVDFKTGDERLIDLGIFKIEKAKIGKDLGKVLVLNTIYYDLNSSYLRADAKIELNKVVKALNDNPTFKIELGSHTDCRQTHQYNDWLSNRRASRAADYIIARIKNGKNRVISKGYGETKLLNNCDCELVDTNCSEEQHQLNRRTEFIIIE